MGCISELYDRVRRPLVIASATAFALSPVLPVLANEESYTSRHTSSRHVDSQNNNNYASQEKQEAQQRLCKVVGLNLVSTQTRLPVFGVVVGSDRLGPVEGNLSDHASSLSQIAGENKINNAKYIAIFALTKDAKEKLLVYAQAPHNTSVIDTALDQFVDDFLKYPDVNADEYLCVQRDQVVVDEQSILNGAVSVDEYTENDLKRVLESDGTSLNDKEVQALGVVIKITSYVRAMQLHVADGYDEDLGKNKQTSHCGDELFTAIATLNEMLERGEVRVFFEQFASTKTGVIVERFSFLFNFGGKALAMHFPDEDTVFRIPGSNQPTAYYVKPDFKDKFLSRQELKPGDDGYNRAMDRVKKYTGAEKQGNAKSDPCPQQDPLTRPVPVPSYPNMDANRNDNRSNETSGSGAALAPGLVGVLGLLGLIGFGRSQKTRRTA